MKKTGRFPLCRSRGPGAFTLIELLVVIAIIAVIGGFATPALNSVLQGNALNQAVNTLDDTVAYARQHAITRNRSVEVRIYRFWDPEAAGEPAGSAAAGLDTAPPAIGYAAPYRALQAFEIGDSANAIPVGRLAFLPGATVFSLQPALSSLLGNTDSTKGPVKTTPASGDIDLPRGIAKNYEYIAFRIKPDGSTTLSPSGGASPGGWFITGHLLKDMKRAASSTPPPNFFTWIIDPVSSSTKILRPGLK